MTAKQWSLDTRKEQDGYASAEHVGRNGSWDRQEYGNADAAENMMEIIIFQR